MKYLVILCVSLSLIAAFLWWRNEILTAEVTNQKLINKQLRENLKGWQDAQTKANKLLLQLRKEQNKECTQVDCWNVKLPDSFERVREQLK
ncbi:MAG: hypothetical protein IJ529_06330 [Alphaproteobacteria bacterium]|nr:hypothetical protein [Alphaproteobacteria bacterium]MBQ9236226.1 hypothetical protein [Alphaproteobacteria bacterium]